MTFYRMPFCFIMKRLFQILSEHFRCRLKFYMIHMLKLCLQDGNLIPVFEVDLFKTYPLIVGRFWPKGWNGRPARTFVRAKRLRSVIRFANELESEMKVEYMRNPFSKWLRWFTWVSILHDNRVCSRQFDFQTRILMIFTAPAFICWHNCCNDFPCVEAKRVYLSSTAFACG